MRGGCVDAENYEFRINFFNGEFDPGSGLTLAARLTHASRTVKQGLPCGSVADG